MVERHGVDGCIVGVVLVVVVEDTAMVPWHRRLSNDKNYMLNKPKLSCFQSSRSLTQALALRMRVIIVAQCCESMMLLRSHTLAPSSVSSSSIKVFSVWPHKIEIRHKRPRQTQQANDFNFN